MKSSIFVALVYIVLMVQIIQGIPWIAESRKDQYGFERHHLLKNITETKKDKINIIFYGDSITDGWRGPGLPIWQEKYAPLGAENYGIFADRTENLLFRIADGEVDSLNPKLVVLLIGTNNIGDGNSVHDVVRGVKAVVDLLRERLPSSKILLLGILPRNQFNEFAKVSEINGILFTFANNEKNNVYFLDMFNEFIIAWGELDMNLYRHDKLHIITSGYKKWADTMDSIFNQLIQ